MTKFIKHLIACAAVVGAAAFITGCACCGKCEEKKASACGMACCADGKTTCATCETCKAKK
jgi:hypothetical protein